MKRIVVALIVIGLLFNCEILKADLADGWILFDDFSTGELGSV